jgi:hypothetical protein
MLFRSVDEPFHTAQGIPSIFASATLPETEFNSRRVGACLGRMFRLLLMLFFCKISQPFGLVGQSSRVARFDVLSVYL